MPPTDKEMYDLFCKDRFNDLEKAVTNDLPHKIDALFWKVVWLMCTVAGIVFTAVQLTK